MLVLSRLRATSKNICGSDRRCTKKANWKVHETDVHMQTYIDMTRIVNVDKARGVCQDRARYVVFAYPAGSKAWCESMYVIFHSEYNIATLCRYYSYYFNTPAVISCIWLSRHKHTLSVFISRVLSRPPRPVIHLNS